MKKESTKNAGNTGTKIYVNRRHEAWDLENVVYRPLLGGLDLIFSVIFRVCDRLMDWIIVGSRKTVYKDSKLPHELEEGTALTHTVGVS